MSGRPIRVMIVDDSTACRAALGALLGGTPDIDVGATASNGREALERLSERVVDVILLDVEMPEMDGLVALPLLRQLHGDVQILMLSARSRSGAAAALRALQLGAADFIEKPTTLRAGRTVSDVQTELLAKIRAIVRATTPVPPRGAPPARRRAVLRPPPRLLVVGASTGGPKALTEFLGALGSAARVPILVVQHMPPVFTALLAQQLERDLGRPCSEAVDNERVGPGRIVIAPGGMHMTVASLGDQVVVRLDSGAPENSCRPSLDPLFCSAAEAFGAAAVCVVLTGMGQDGSRGASAVAAAGGLVMAQDEESSVVWGMPGAVVKLGIAERTGRPAELAMSVLGVIRHAA